MQCVVNSSPAPAGLSGGYIQLWNYSLIDVNLGGLGSPGVQGPTGVGLPGTGAYSTFQNSNFISEIPEFLSVPIARKIPGYSFATYLPPKQ